MQMTVTVTVPFWDLLPVTRKFVGGVVLSGPTWSRVFTDPALTVKPPPMAVLPAGHVATTFTGLLLLMFEEVVRTT